VSDETGARRILPEPRSDIVLKVLAAGFILLVLQSQ
jgi:hypothetical protein